MFALETLAVGASLLSFGSGIVMWYGATIQKRYAAQRDFEHLKRNLAQWAAQNEQLEKELDRRFDTVMLELKDMKGLVTAILVNIPEVRRASKPDQSP